ncbi:hypothetical protein A2U01_0025372, partial [Trifolium medium]|nr:hypothetical protein [Trifolium medium]
DGAMMLVNVAVHVFQLQDREQLKLICTFDIVILDSVSFSKYPPDAKENLNSNNKV